MITYLIQDHQIQFTRKAMGQAHQAFPREFAEWNLALKLKGKALLPGVSVRAIAKPCTTWSDTAQEAASAGVPYPECTDAGRESEQAKVVDTAEPAAKEALASLARWMEVGGE